MNLIEILTQYEEDLKTVIVKLEANQHVDLKPLAESWKDFLLSIKQRELTTEESEIFNRSYAYFKKIEDILSEKMSELVMARSMTQNK